MGQQTSQSKKVSWPVDFSIGDVKYWLNVITSRSINDTTRRANCLSSSNYKTTSHLACVLRYSRISIFRRQLSMVRSEISFQVFERRTEKNSGRLLMIRPIRVCLLNGIFELHTGSRSIGWSLDSLKKNRAVRSVCVVIALKKRLVRVSSFQRKGLVANLHWLAVLPGWMNGHEWLSGTALLLSTVRWTSILHVTWSRELFRIKPSLNLNNSIFFS